MGKGREKNERNGNRKFSKSVQHGGMEETIRIFRIVTKVGGTFLFNLKNIALVVLAEEVYQFSIIKLSGNSNLALHFASFSQSRDPPLILFRVLARIGIHKSAYKVDS